MRLGSWIVGIVAGVAALAALAPLRVTALQIGQAAPALIVRQLDGTLFDLSAQRGKVVLVDFWASWCPPCRAEMPVLDSFYRQFHDRGVEVIGVSVDRPHDRGAVEQLAQSLSYRVAMLADARRNGFAKPSALPVLYVIDTSGTIRARITPEEEGLSKEEISNIVTRLLPEQISTAESHPWRLCPPVWLRESARGSTPGLGVPPLAGLIGFLSSCACFSPGKGGAQEPRVLPWAMRTGINRFDGQSHPWSRG